jgi:hypothetical protein
MLTSAVYIGVNTASIGTPSRTKRIKGPSTLVVLLGIIFKVLDSLIL